ncbi:MAG: uracil-DNA glycosylase [Patescibacteria group bacterium]
MVVKINESWKNVLGEEFEKSYFRALTDFVRAEYLSTKIFPPAKLVFNAFELCPYEAVKVVILGQDPYHGAGQAEGLCFSVPAPTAIPPSLQNIYKEIAADVGGQPPNHGHLESWARQGILLLNATLTVRAGVAGSHQGQGWETFTDAVIEKISRTKKNVVFLLWGNYAKNKKGLINGRQHLILEAAHPSPFSAANGFFGCRHFSQTNAYLQKTGQTPIQWF